MLIMMNKKIIISTLTECRLTQNQYQYCQKRINSILIKRTMRCQINEHLTHNCIYCSFQHASFKLPEIRFLSTFTIKLWENKWHSILLPNFFLYHSFIDIFCELIQERNIFHLNNNNNLPSKSFERKLIKIRYRKREVLSIKYQKLQRTENWKKYKEQI